MSVRDALLARIATTIIHLDAERPIIAVDGVDGAGKTTFANELAPHIVALGRTVVRASVDGFHNPRSVRYRCGKNDPQGFFLDSYDYSGLERDLLRPFRTGAAEVQTVRFDHKTDQEVTTATIRPEPNAVLLMDGIFLHRNELRDIWDLSIFLDVPFAVSYARMADRDGSNPDPHVQANHRYLEGQRIYLRNCRPEERATLLIDNSDLEFPVLRRDRSSS